MDLFFMRKPLYTVNLERTFRSDELAFFEFLIKSLDNCRRKTKSPSLWLAQSYHSVPYYFQPKSKNEVHTFSSYSLINRKI